MPVSRCRHDIDGDVTSSSDGSSTSTIGEIRQRKSMWWQRSMFRRSAVPLCDTELGLNRSSSDVSSERCEVVDPVRRQVTRMWTGEPARSVTRSSSLKVRRRRRSPEPIHGRSNMVGRPTMSHSTQRSRLTPCRGRYAAGCRRCRTDADHRDDRWRAERSACRRVVSVATASTKTRTRDDQVLQRKPARRKRWT